MSSGNLPESAYTELIEYQNPEPIQDSSLNVMTYNVGYLSGMTNNQSTKREETFFNENLAKAKSLNKLNPDVVGFQEIDFNASRSFGINQMDSIASTGNYASGYKSINWDKTYVPFPYWPPSNHFGRMISGQAILSNCPIKKSETLVLSRNTDAPYYYRAFYLDRLLQVVEVDFLGTSVMIMNVHLEAFDKETRLRQIEQVKDAFEKYSSEYPVILMGDFNSEIPAPNQLDAIDILMETPWIASAIPFEEEPSHRTFSSEKPVRMIDYIFYNENFLTCTAYDVLDEVGQISDHLPILASFKLKSRT